MCGIFAYLGPRNTAGTIVLDGLKSLEYRGYDSWGVAVKKKNGALFIKKEVGKIGNATLPALLSHVAIGHTRWATHGGVTKKNAHPHTSCNDKVVIVHNGIIENFEELRKKLTREGHRFVSETDTEVGAHLIEHHLHKTKNITSATLAAFRQLSGMNALIAFEPATTTFCAVKNGSPLVFGCGKKGEYFLASDAAALVPYTKNVYFLHDNEILTITSKGYRLATLKGTKHQPVFTHLNYESTDTSLGHYSHYMIKEISEQPTVLNNIILNDQKNIERLAEHIKKAFGTYFVGCGSAYYACLAGSYLFAKIAKRHVNTATASEFSYQLDFIKDSSRIVALSQSGETIDVISAVREAKKHGAKLTAITNVLGSTLYRMADDKMLLNAGTEKCVLTTKAFTAKIAVMLLMAYSLNSGFKKSAAQLKKAIAEVKRLIHSAASIKKLASMLVKHEHLYVLGRGLSYPLALESALKIKEVSYIHAEGFAGGELKHGVIALIEKGTPVIVYNPEDETYNDTLSSAHEVGARGAYVIGVSSKKSKIFDHFIEVKDCNEASVIPHVVVAQLLGYYLALAKGYDPDKPRNLAKSVTVK